MTLRGPRRLRRLAWLLLPAVGLLGCWKQAPDPTPPKPRPAVQPPARPAATPVNAVIELASQSFHTCARRQGGDVLCWGKNTYGQLGDGRREDSARLVKVAGLADAAELVVGRDFSCARRRAGSVVCWGNNEDGQLGDGRGMKPGALSLRPVKVAGLRAPQQLSAGEYHACALEQGGVVKCWGNGGNGQIGSDAQRAFGMPLTIERLGAVVQLASGSSHVCALEKVGVVKCWGRNTEGQLGDGKSGSRIKAVTVLGLEDAVELASGHRHTCARRSTGTVTCWGDNARGQLGPNAGREPKSHVPVEVPGLSSVVQLAGGGEHTCARLQSGRLVCWGGNAAGQLGHKSSITARPTPTAVRGMGDAVDLALGAAHTCAVRRSGEVACWGDAEYGALGPYRLI